MKPLKSSLLSSTVVPVMLVAAGLLAACDTAPSSGSKPRNVAAANPCAAKRNPCNPCAAKRNPCAAKRNPCNPCAAKRNPCNPCGARARANPCNPCAAKRNPCNPCAAKRNPCNPCNPCSAKRNPCNPCAAGNPCNPCNPCAAGGGAVSAKCVVPRLVTAAANPCNPCNPCAAKRNPCNPCAAKRNPCNPCGARANPCNPCAAKRNPCNPCGARRNPCNPCAAKRNPCNPCAAKRNPCNPCGARARANPCNPCAAKRNPCNPCAAKNPCNPCGAKNPCNPCNPCGAAEAPELNKREAIALYNCLKGEMKAAYAKSGNRHAGAYTRWAGFNTQPYVSATHGGRFVNNYANAKARNYGRYEKAGNMPAGAVLAKNSFTVTNKGRAGVGPLFLMEKMSRGFNKSSHDWRYTLLMPTGAVVGTTNGRGSANVKFCIECHVSVAEDQDSLMFLPEELRRKR